MSERHNKLCREAIKHPSQSLRSEWTDYVQAHPPELTLALWECYEALERIGPYSCVERVEELTRD